MAPMFELYDLAPVDAVYLSYLLIVCVFVVAIFTGESD